MTERVDVVVVGGGILGLAAARAVQQDDPRLVVVVLEREPAVAHHQSSHNSGVLHAGVYYQPGSLKARLCREGKAAMERYCVERGIGVTRNGKLVVAVDPSELARLDALTERARANRVEGVRVLHGDELRDVEPNVAGIRALHSPGTAVVDFGEVCRVLAGELPDVRLGIDVGAVENRSGLVHVDTSAGVIEARHAIVCAGLWSERMARSTELRIVPFRGAWLALRPRAAELVRGNVYPVPDPALPFLGVHLTRRVDGTVWAGPNAVLSLSQPRRSRVRCALAGRGVCSLTTGALAPASCGATRSGARTCGRLRGTCPHSPSQTSSRVGGRAECAPKRSGATAP